jgi:hypothetical protein
MFYPLRISNRFQQSQQLCSYRGEFPDHLVMEMLSIRLDTRWRLSCDLCRREVSNNLMAQILQHDCCESTLGQHHISFITLS